MEGAHQSDVVAIAMVMIAGDIATRAVFDFPRSVAKAIPDRFAFAVLVPCAFDLISGRGGAPIEIPGESNGGGRKGNRARQERRDCGCGQGPEKLATSSQGDQFEGAALRTESVTRPEVCTEANYA